VRAGINTRKKETICLISLGCPKNLVDSEVILGYLNQSGFQITTKREAAEIIIINTCAFIKEATQESLQTIFESARYKKQGKCRLLIVAGCLPQRYREKLAEELHEVDLFIGTGKLPEIARIIHGFKNYRIEDVIQVGNPEFLLNHDTPRLLSTPSHTAYVKIAEGCSNCCSYCLIPSLRGRYRSRTVDSIIQETETLARKGVKEINLISQDTTRYGDDLSDGTNLTSLLKGLVKIQGIEWIRLLYSHPEHFSDELVSLVAQEEKICKYLDIPIQHINSSILKKMNRRGNRRALCTLFSRIREFIPDITLRTTVMVGFPGETNKEFTELLRFIEVIRFDHLGVFRYSREEGTPAAQLKKQIPQRIKDKRHNLIMKTQSLISLKRNQERIGSRIKVLIEKKSSQGDYPFQGRGSFQAPEIDGVVYLTKSKGRIGEIIEAKVTGASEYDLIAEGV
jgi:ribosomal protein S12 methylthiotransferase